VPRPLPSSNQAKCMSPKVTSVLGQRHAFKQGQARRMNTF
jgi:hypothetical protein